jgi:hypothetical protein
MNGASVFRSGGARSKINNPNTPGGGVTRPCFTGTMVIAPKKGFIRVLQSSGSMYAEGALNLHIQTVIALYHRLVQGGD